jgi:hypothetical protein
VDRFDTWLNAQRGWRRLALIGAALYAPTVTIGFCSWLGFELWAAEASPDPTLSALAICAIVLLGVPVALGLGSVRELIYAREARNPRRKKALPPFLTWRNTALFWLMFATFLLATRVADRGSGPLTTGHRVLVGLQLFFAIALIAVCVETLRYHRRLARTQIK